MNREEGLRWLRDLSPLRRIERRPHRGDAQGCLGILLDKNAKVVIVAKANDESEHLGDDKRGEPIEGSSSMRTFGLAVIAQQTASIFCSPPDMVPAACQRRSTGRMYSL